MKRYRDLTLQCIDENEAMLVLSKIIDSCDKYPFIYDKKIEKQFAFQSKGVVRIHAIVPNKPEAVIVVSASGSELKVLNIIPYNKSTIKISKDEYNQILERFYNDIVIHVSLNSKVVSTSFSEAEYTIESLIPLSIEEFLNWANCPEAPNNPFSHPDDLKRWFDFVIAIVKNKERGLLSSGDLEQWLVENKWTEDVIEETILYYEHDTYLINYECNKL